MSYLDDPRVFFAAERTLLAWQRTSIALMGLGFVIERFGLFIKIIDHSSKAAQSQSTLSLYIGVAFLLVGAITALCSALQFLLFCRLLSAQEIPKSQLFWLAPFINLFLSLSAIGLSLWLIFSR